MWPRLLTPAFLLVLFLSATAHADPVVITGGTATVVRQFFLSSRIGIDVAGGGFRLEGLGALQRDPPGCLCANGQTTRFGELFLGTNDPTGVSQTSIRLTAGGVTYDWPGFYTSMSLGVSTPSTTITVPPGNPETFTILLPFTASGSYRINNNTTFQTIDSGTLTGQGQAEVLLRRDGNTSFYVTQSVTYRFQDPAATPEPASLTLLGLGAAGAWLFRRRKAKR